MCVSVTAEPPICSNSYDYKHTNGTPYHLFICPKENQTEDYSYCCGEETRQRCCSYDEFKAYVCKTMF